MARLGISVYPEHSKLEEDWAYIQMAGTYGYKRMFTCLLSAGNKQKEELIKDFQLRIDAAHKAGMEVILDINPKVLKKLGASSENMSVFQEMHADGIRLDEGFDGRNTSMLTYNPYKLSIELNASTEMGYIENVMSHVPDKSKLITCHNFYPQKYTGLSLEHFEDCNRFIHNHGLNIAAFISSIQEDAYGPWPVNEGLCTLEMHRGLPADFQVRHMFAGELVNDVIFGNAYASEEELKVCASINPALLTFTIEVEKELTKTEQDILYYKQGHVVRGDMSEYMIRSSNPRVTFLDYDIPAGNTRNIVKGDVIILNDGYGRYKGELHIALKDMENDGRKNVIGHIPAYETILLNYAKPWRPFVFL